MIVERGKARAFTRNGHDWTDRYPHIVAAAQAIPARAAIIDGEAIVQNELGVSDFRALRSSMTTEPHRVLFIAFDLLHLDGKDIQHLPLDERHAKLFGLLAGSDPHSAIHFSEAVEGDSKAIFMAAEALGVEGIVSKRTDSRYSSGRSRDWLKTKAMVDGEFVVVGVEPNPGGPPFALLARDDGGKLTYVGSAFVTLPQKERDKFWEDIEPLKTPKPALRDIKGRQVS